MRDVESDHRLNVRGVGQVVDAELALRIAAEHASAHCARLDAALGALLLQHTGGGSGLGGGGGGGVTAERFDLVRPAGGGGGWRD